MIEFFIENHQVVTVFLITAVMFALFATENMRPDLLAMCVLATLGPTRALSTDELLGCFSNSAPVTVAAMFVPGAGGFKFRDHVRIGAPLDLITGSSPAS